MTENKKEEVQEVTLKQFIKIVSTTKGMNITETARASGREQSTLSNILSRGNVNLKALSEILGGLDESLVVCTKNGQKYKLVF